MPIFLHHLKQSGRLDQLNVTICNVGSRKLEHADDYASLGWSLFAPNLTIYGFDADADACEDANASLGKRSVNWKEVHIPLAMSDTGGERTLYVTKHPMCSSLYPPNEPFLDRFDGFGVAKLDFMVEIETTTLDTFCEDENVETIDFLQIDVQGADLDVLTGATKILQTVLASQIEIEFAPLYKDQPLFGDIDTFFRKKGFTLFDMKCNYSERARSPIKSSRHPGQLLWGEAYYFRDLLLDQGISSEHHKTPEQILKMACIADVMDFSDYGLELLEYLTLTYGKDPTYNFADLIAQSLRDVPGLAKLSNQDMMALPMMVNLKPYFTGRKLT